MAGPGKEQEGVNSKERELEIARNIFAGLLEEGLTFDLLGYQGEQRDQLMAYAQGLLANGQSSYLNQNSPKLMLGEKEAQIRRHRLAKRQRIHALEPWTHVAEVETMQLAIKRTEHTPQGIPAFKGLPEGDIFRLHLLTLEKVPDLACELAVNVLGDSGVVREDQFTVYEGIDTENSVMEVGIMAFNTTQKQLAAAIQGRTHRDLVARWADATKLQARITEPLPPHKLNYSLRRFNPRQYGSQLWHPVGFRVLHEPDIRVRSRSERRLPDSGGWQAI